VPRAACLPSSSWTSIDSPGRRRVGIWSSSKVTEWNKAVSDAEKIVGYSTSFLSLRCLLSDELSNVAMQMRKLVGTGHPLLKTARKLFYGGQNSLQTRGLLVLLMAKAAGPTCNQAEFTEVMVSGIYPSQRTLAEVVEMIHTAGLIHKGIVNISPVLDQRSSVSSGEDLEFGNKMAVLSGDFLLANASTGLAGLNNTHVVELMSIAIGDMTKAEFTELRDCNGNAVFPADGTSIEDWEQQTFLSSGSLIARGCKAALMLAHHSEQLQQQAFEFGKHIALAYQLNEELQQLQTGDDSQGNGFSVTSAPFILYMNSSRCKLTSTEVNSTKNYKNLARLILKDGSTLKEARSLRNVYGQQALNVLQHFNKSDARSALENIVNAAIAS
jgi:decaprenyl-diphosphate synthase subunit 2